MRFKNYMRIFCMVLCCTILFTACNGADNSSNSGAETVIGESTGLKTTKVGFIYNNVCDGNGYIKAFEKARGNIGNALSVETEYMDNVMVSQFEQAADALVEDGCKVLVSASNVFNNAAYSYAKRNKEVKVLSYGAFDFLSNMTTFQWKPYQPVYIGGMVAAYNSSARKFGVVTDSGMYGYLSVINSFTLGVQKLYSREDTDVSVSYTGTDEETKTAIDKLAANGCDVILVYKDTEYGIEYCNEKGIKVIGYTDSINEIAPDTGLLGFYPNFSTYLVDQIRDYTNDCFNAAYYCGGFVEGVTRMSDYTKKCKDGTQTIGDTLYDYLKKGQAEVFEGELIDVDNNTQLAKGSFYSHTQIIQMTYMVQGVTAVNTYVEPNYQTTGTDFAIKS